VNPLYAAHATMCKLLCLEYKSQVLQRLRSAAWGRTLSVTNPPPRSLSTLQSKVARLDSLSTRTVRTMSPSSVLLTPAALQPTNICNAVHFN
jgi:hypothetical protein